MHDIHYRHSEEIVGRREAGQQAMEVYSKERILRIREIDWEEEWSQFRKKLEDFAEEAGGGWVVKVSVGKGNARRVEGSSERPQAVFRKIAEVVEQEWTDGSDVSIEITARCEVGLHDYVDENDREIFEEAEIHAPEGTARPDHLEYCPMFLRLNGAPVELVNLYRGRSVFVIGNGPSFEEIDQGLLRQPGIVTFGMNNGGHLFRPHLWACVDEPIRFLDSIWKDPTIMKFVPLGHMAKPIWDTKENRTSRDSVADYPTVTGFRRNECFDAERWLWEPTINWGNHKDRGGGRSVMLAILRICHLLGFRQVYLVGCDFHMNEQSKYWFAEHRSSTAIRNNQYSFQRLSEYFGQLKPKFDEAAFEVYNTNPRSNLEVFPFKDLKQAVAESVVDTSAGTYGMYEKPKA